MTNDPLEDAITAWYARKPNEYGRPTSADAIRWGWEAAMQHMKQVPREPTDTMCRAAQRNRLRAYDDTEEWYADAWRAMYDAALPPKEAK